MKAIILELRDGWAAALREDGVVVRVRRSGKVGQTIELDEKTVRFPAKRKRFLRAAIAAVLVLAVTGGTYTYTSVAEASYITLDTQEQSIEFAVNRMGRVIDVRALDDGSEDLARELLPDVRRMRVEDAMDVIVTRMDGAPQVVFGVTGETDRGTAALHKAVERGAERREHSGMELFLFEITRDERREAHGHDMSGGRWAFERQGGEWGPPPPPPTPPPPDGPKGG